jgi:MFS family permease
MDAFGRKPTMIAIVGVYTLGGILVTAAQNIAMFIAARFIHGFAAVSFIACSMS